MKKFSNNNKFENLINLLETYEHTDGSIFNSAVLDNILESMITDFDRLDRTFEEQKAKTNQNNLEIIEQFRQDLRNLVNNNNHLIKSYELTKQDQKKAFAKQIEQEKNIAKENYKKDQEEFEPHVLSLKREIKENNESTVAELKAVNQELSAKLSSVEKNIREIENQTQRLVTEEEKKLTSNQKNKNKNVIEETNKFQKDAKDINKQFNDVINELLKEIEINKSQIANNTAKANDVITDYNAKSSEERVNKLDYFTGKIQELNNEDSENQQTYKDVSSAILNDFTNKLKSIDENISELRELERLLDEKYLADLKNHHKEFADDANKKLQEYDTQINNLRNFMRHDGNEQDNEKQKILNKLIKKRINLAKNLQVEEKKQKEDITKKYVLGKCKYIEELEDLRTERSIYESIKNNAFKNINLEQLTKSNITSSEKRNYDLNLSNTNTAEQYKDNIKGLNVRYQTESENNVINHTISVKKNKIKKQDFTLQCRLKQNEIEHQKELDIIEERLYYNKKLIAANIDLNQVTGLLKIQQEDIRANYYKKCREEKINYINLNQEFLTQATNIQYELNKLELDSMEKNYDLNLAYLEEKIKAFNNYIDTLQKFDLSALDIEMQKNESNKRLRLFDNRFTNEETLIAASFDMFYQKMMIIIAFENFLLSHFSASSLDIFINSIDSFKTLITELELIKQACAIEYETNIKNIIYDRIEFSNNAKYKKVLEELKATYQQDYDEITKRIAKLNETINNYESTILIFTEENKKLLEGNSELIKTGAKYKQTQIAENTKLIKANYEKININKKNIKSLSASLKRQNKMLTELQLNYEAQVEIINLRSNEDAKKYEAYLNRLEKSITAFIDKLNSNKRILSTNFPHAKLLGIANKLIVSNNHISQLMRNNYREFAKLLNSVIYIELLSLRRNYLNTYTQATKNILLQISEEKHNYDVVLAKLLSEYNSDIVIQKAKFNNERAVLLRKLKEATSFIINKRRINRNNLAKLEKEYHYTIACAEDNINNYQADARHKEDIITKEYNHNISNIILAANTKIKEVDQELKNYDKHYKASIKTINDDKALLDHQNTVAYHNSLNNYKQKIAELGQNTRDNTTKLKSDKKALYASYKGSLQKNRLELKRNISDLLLKKKSKTRDSQNSFKKSFYKQNEEKKK